MSATSGWNTAWASEAWKKSLPSRRSRRFESQNTAFASLQRHAGRYWTRGLPEVPRQPSSVAAQVPLPEEAWQGSSAIFFWVIVPSTVKKITSLPAGQATRAWVSASVRSGQSVMSVPSGQMDVLAPGPPSSQEPFASYRFRAGSAYPQPSFCGRPRGWPGSDVSAGPPSKSPVSTHR